MTETEARKIYVDAAKSYLGFSEASGKHRKIIDLYNTGNLPRGYRLTYADLSALVGNYVEVYEP